MSLNTNCPLPGNTFGTTPSNTPANFCHGCGQPLHLRTAKCPHCGAEQFNPFCSPVITAQSHAASTKNRVTAGVLALLLGGLGLHKTYLGAYGTALIYLALCWTGLPMLVSFIEGARYLSLTDAEFKSKASDNPGPFQFIW